MKDLMPEERPVEKYLSRGATALSNGELLAIILRTGTGEENALELAQRLLREAGGSLRSLADMDVELLRTLKGIGRKKAACLGASLELGRRFFEEGNTVSRVSVNRPEDVYRAMIPHLRGRDHEECWVLYLNAANYVICKEMESLGGSAIPPEILVRESMTFPGRMISAMPCAPLISTYWTTLSFPMAASFPSAAMA